MVDSRDTVVPLGALLPGQRGTIVNLSGGRAFVSRCLALGCTPGTRVRMERNNGRGPVIVVVRGARLALGRGEAMRVQVTR
ncbi:MAG: FeoA family protein [Dehalococcoidia bacterium]|nr:FeoA family protein [Dehalococcoidia bacterium]